MQALSLLPAALTVKAGGSRPRALAVSLGIAMSLLLAGAASALEPAKDEKDKLKACERKLCDMVRGKKGADAASGDYACTLAKTWGQSAIESGAKRSAVSWTFGDARCKVDVSLARAMVVAALSSPKFALESTPHQINCEVERSGEIKPVTAVVAPRIEFKDGKADKAWIGLKSVEGPGDIKALVSTLTKLHDKAGLFHGSTIKSINKLLYKTCDEEYPAKKH